MLHVWGILNNNNEIKIWFKMDIKKIRICVFKKVQKCLLKKVPMKEIASQSGFHRVLNYLYIFNSLYFMI